MTTVIQVNYDWRLFCRILTLFITSLASDPLAAEGDDRYHPLPSGKTRKTWGNYQSL